MAKLIDNAVGSAINGSSIRTTHIAPKPNWHPYTLLLGSSENVQRYVKTRQLVPGRWKHVTHPADLNAISEVVNGDVCDVVRLRGWNESMDSAAAFAEIQNRAMVKMKLPTPKG